MVLPIEPLHEHVKSSLHFICLSDFVGCQRMFCGGNVVHVCAHGPVQGTLVWDAPGFLWERLTFQLWWIRLLLTHCVSSFGKLDFRKPNRSRTWWGWGWGWGVDVGRGTDLCLWYFMREWNISVQATLQTISDWKPVTTTPFCCQF